MSKTTIESIDQAIRILRTGGHPARPFLCEGSPLNCEVAIVGFNPGTETDFWAHWSLPYGCDRRGWLASFKDNPANNRKKTRHCLEELYCELAPVCCLELNLYPYYSPDQKRLPKSLREPAFFDFMLRAVKPRILLVYGTLAIRHLKKSFDLEALSKGKFTRCEKDGLKLDVYADYHFSWYARQKGGLEGAKVHAHRIGQVLKQRALTIRKGFN